MDISDKMYFYKPDDALDSFERACKYFVTRTGSIAPTHPRHVASSDSTIVSDSLRLKLNNTFINLPINCPWLVTFSSIEVSSYMRVEVTTKIVWLKSTSSITSISPLISVIGIRWF